MKNKVPGLGPDLMKLNSQQLQSVLSSKEKAFRITQLLWNEILGAAKLSSFDHQSQKTIHTYLTNRVNTLFHVTPLTINRSCISQPVKNTVLLLLFTHVYFFICDIFGSIWAFLWTKMYLVFTVESPLHHKSTLVLDKTQVFRSVHLCAHPHTVYERF